MVSARNVAILERFWAVARLSKVVFVHFGLLRLFVLAAAIETAGTVAANLETTSSD